MTMTASFEGLDGFAYVASDVLSASGALTDTASVVIRFEFAQRPGVLFAHRGVCLCSALVFIWGWQED